MRKTTWAPFKYFGVVFVLETLHTCGLAILFYAVLPNLDTLRAGMVANGVLLFPSMLSILRYARSSSSKATKYILIALDGKFLIENIIPMAFFNQFSLSSTVFALLMQISGIIIWPVMNINWIDESSQNANASNTYWILKNSWALPLGLFLTSFGWWESFVDENIVSKRNFLWRVKINMTEEGSRFTTYMFISLWKIALFFCLFLFLSKTVVSQLNMFANLIFYFQNCVYFLGKYF